MPKLSTTELFQVLVGATIAVVLLMAILYPIVEALR
jgi:hypothetical protein